MKNMIKKLVLICLFLSLASCSKNDVQPFTFTMFYANWCGICEAAKDKFIPELEKEFGSAITIIYYDIDSKEGQEAYKQYIGYIDENGNEVEGLLKNVAVEFKEIEQFPLFIVDDSYGFFNFTTAYIDEFISDIKSSLNNKKINEDIYDEIYFFQ